MHRKLEMHFSCGDNVLSDKPDYRWPGRAIYPWTEEWLDQLIQVSQQIKTGEGAEYWIQSLLLPAISI